MDPLIFAGLVGVVGLVEAEAYATLPKRESCGALASHDQHIKRLVRNFSRLQQHQRTPFQCFPPSPLEFQPPLRMSRIVTFSKLYDDLGAPHFRLTNEFKMTILSAAALPQTVGICEIDPILRN
jgi:hypothetical protein